MDKMLVFSLIILSFQILFGITIGKRVKAGETLCATNGVFGTLLAVLFHITWWMSPPTALNHYEGWRLLVPYVILTIASTAFLLGIAFMTTGCVTVKEDTLCINKDNKIFKLFSILPLEYEGKSVCAISWLAALSILFIPPTSLILGFLFFFITLFICSFTAQNVKSYFLEGAKLEHWPDTKMNTFSNGWPKGISCYLAPVLVLYGLYVLIFLNTGVFFTIVKVIGFLVIAVASLYFIGGLLANFVDKIFTADQTTYDQLEYKTQRNIVEFRSAKGPDRNAMAYSLIFQIFKQKFCPKLKYCSRENNDCDEG